MDHVINEATLALASGSSPTAVGVPTHPHPTGSTHPHPTGSHLITAGAPGPDALTVMAATPGRTVLPEVDEVHQWLRALDAHKAGRMPLLVVACPVRVDHWAVGGSHPLAQFTNLERWRRTPKLQGSQESIVTRV